MRIAVVGPCAAGKSVLVHALQAEGYDAHQCSQEHSEVPTMWQLIGKPDVLIYLDASLETIVRRRQISWGEAYLRVLNQRLEHARQHCHLYIQTDQLSPEDVKRQVVTFLEGIKKDVRKSERCLQP